MPTFHLNWGAGRSFWRRLLRGSICYLGRAAALLSAVWPPTCQTSLVRHGDWPDLSVGNIAIAKAPLLVLDSKESEPCAPLEAVIKEVLPDGIDRPAAVRSTDKKGPLIKYLGQLKRADLAPRCQLQLSFLSALLDTDYKQNRDNLVGALRTCGSARTNCDENTVQYVIALYRQGHRELLGALLNVGTGSDGGASDLLGDFYRDTLVS